MLQSHIVEIDGNFVGAAVRQHDGYRFVAVDVRLHDLDASLWPSLADVHRVARRLFVDGNFGRPPTYVSKATGGTA